MIDLSDQGNFSQSSDVRDQRQYQRRIDELFSKGAYQWGLSGYLEKRENLLSECRQMVEEQRFYHLGLDIIVPLGTPLLAPLAATVEENGYESGEGNYGSYVLLRHESNDFEPFFSFYGHLKKSALPPSGTRLKPGEPFARIGDFHENGNWFYHTHLQVMSLKGLEQGFQSKGYCCAATLSVIDDLCPNPLFLFRA